MTMPIQPEPIFRVANHRIEGQHIRQYPKATASSDIDSLWLDINQYVPVDNPNPTPGDVTIIAANGIGFAKEFYEPLFEQIWREAPLQDFRIRAIWIADPAAMGVSGSLNEDRLGNEPHWFDHSRDLLHMVNTFRKEMPRPLIGMGHSYGGAQMLHLSTLHPRLFTSLVLIEPSIMSTTSSQVGITMAKAMLKRREQWPTRGEAETSIRRSPYYKRWHPDTLKRVLAYGIRGSETNQSDDEADPSVSYTNTKHTELMHMYKPDSADIGRMQIGDISADQRATAPEIDPAAPPFARLYRPESRMAFQSLPTVLPSVLYIVGTKTGFSTPDIRKARMETTGTGVGGSGGALHGRVREYVVQDGQHTVPLDMHMEETARAGAAWIGEEVRRWRRAEDKHAREWHPVDAAAKKRVSHKTLDLMRASPDMTAKAKPKAKL